MACVFCDLCSWKVVLVVLVIVVGKSVSVVPPYQVCFNKINSPPQAPPPPPSPLHWCLRFHLAIPDLPGFEVDLRVVPSDPSSSWADLLAGASPYLLNLVLLVATTASLQPQILLTATATKQLYIRWCLNELVFPLDFDLEFILQAPATTIHTSSGRPVCFSKASSIRLQPLLCTAFHPAVASTAIRR
jgi:hypothetical protein